MSRTRALSTPAIIDEVLTLVRERLPTEQAEPIARFVSQYYRGTAAEDLAEFKIENLYGAAVAHWNVGRQRSLSSSKLHVYNPRLDEHGWQSSHTIVEVIADDMPFLVDSVRMAINRCRLTNHLTIHPVIKIRRDADGNLLDVVDPGDTGEEAIDESYMHFEIDRQTEPSALEEIRTSIENVLSDVLTVVEDVDAMRTRLDNIIEELQASPPPLDPEELSEGRAFLEWLRNDHFIFLGYREQELVRENNEDALRIVPGSALGVLRKTETDFGDGPISRSFAALSPSVRSLAHKPELLVITRSNSVSTVHRTGHMDYVGIKRIDEQGHVVGEQRFLGLYTSAAYTCSTDTIPLLRRKVRNVTARAGFPPRSHAERALANILETYPRDELFQISESVLVETALGILHLQERQHTRTFIRRDPYGRFFSCLVYIPRDRMSTEVRLHIAEILADSLSGECIRFEVQLSESVLARVHYIVRIPPDTEPEYDIQDIEARIVSATRSWRDHLQESMLEHCGEETGSRMYRRYGEGFRADYREYYSPQIAVHDAQKMETLGADEGLAMALYRPLEAPENLLRFKLFSASAPVPLSEALPMLENMGLKVVDEHPSKIKLPDSARVWIHDFGMEHGEAELDLDQVKGIFQDAFARVCRGEASNDGFNRLVLRAGLNWREVTILRTYCKYLRQIRFTFSQSYMEQALASNPSIARLLVELFKARFDPARGEAREEVTEALGQRIDDALDDVANLDEDRILRSFKGVILATLRTNYYQSAPSGAPKSYLSVKLNPERVPDMPQPRPMYEIFVYSPRVEGVHLRGGRVARGGLRWSDRPEDFRTEVLGLVKAQMVKNAVIVPVGSKGGFVPKKLPVDGDRDAILKEGIACYRTFISALLDVTDNLSGGEVVPPRDVVRHDGDDPYLVVAADKGTATFSDIANEVAIDYGFWLGDAFASGGSAGYDHKAMGITARGGWESVKRHFRELNLDIQNNDFTVVGIGDMSGDVFGNGMLLSRHIRLVGAFNHLHIFLDPNPDTEASYRERERLFALPRSSWEDYDQTLISEGGGVYQRSAKSIRLSAQMQALLGVTADALTPNEVMRALLRAPVDLLWNGGIGTYVKASSEQHTEVGDRTNDTLRIDGHELRCRVVGEGGNLGLTQLGRIEFARNGGRIYTDAIDNSAGVDCSDHEVNIKILLNAVVDAGDMTGKQRNRLLAQMTEEVGQLVLANNYEQTEALSLACIQTEDMIEVHGRLMRELELAGKLDRGIEFLPTDDILFERKSAGEGLTSPELAVLLAYVKITIYEKLLASDLPEDEYLGQVLEGYFPTPLREQYSEGMTQHRLRREIIATQVVNSIVNGGGITFTFRMSEVTGADSAEIARAYVISREVFPLHELWAGIEALDTLVAAEEQISMLLDGRKLVERAARWLLRNRPRPLSINGNVAYFGADLALLRQSIHEHLGAEEQEAAQAKATRLGDAGVPKGVADLVSILSPLASGLDLVEVARATGLAVNVVARTYFKVGERLDLPWLRDQIANLPRETHWQAMARAALRDDLFELHRVITGDVLHQTEPDAETTALVDAWIAHNEIAVSRCRQVLAEFRSGPTPDFTMLSVAMRELRSLRQTSISVPSETPAGGVADAAG